MNNFQTYRQFLNYIEINYEEEQQIIIENLGNLGKQKETKRNKGGRRRRRKTVNRF